jgi:hypothetical protein
MYVPGITNNLLSELNFSKVFFLLYPSLNQRKGMQMFCHPLFDAISSFLSLASFYAERSFFEERRSGFNTSPRH